MIRALCERFNPSRFARDERGSVLAETLLVIPFLTLLAAGILEFGQIFWQRQQIETGLRDAARYMARCSIHCPTDCERTARNLAYHGTVDGSGPLRVPNWPGGSETITFTFTYTSTGDEDRVTAETVHTMIESPVLAWLGLGEIAVTANHSQRVIKWKKKDEPLCSALNLASP